MIDLVILKKNGQIWFRKDFDKPILDYRIDLNFIDEFLFSALNTEVALEEGFTLRDFFNMCDRYNLYRFHKTIDNFLAYLHEHPIVDGIPDENLEYLSVQKSYCIDFLKDKNKGYFNDLDANTFTIPAIVSRGHSWEHECMNVVVGKTLEPNGPLISNNFDCQGLGFNFTKYLDLEMRLEPDEFSVSLDHTSIHGKNFISEDCTFTFLEFICGVMYSLTEYGHDPEEIMSVGRGVSQKMDACKKELKKDGM